MKLAILIIFVLALSGCGTINPVTITDSMVNEAGDVIETGIVRTSDVDVVRSTNFKNMRMSRDNVQGKAHKDEGFKMEFTLVELGPGVKAYMPKVISYKPELRFQDPMPQQEMVNPIYQATKDIILGTGDLFLKGWLGWLVKEAHSDSVETAQPKYNGPYNPQNYTNSYNQTAEPYIVQPSYAPVP